MSELKARKQPLQRRSKDTVEAILGAAAQVLVEAGVEGATTNRVAKRAGVSIGSLYQYFPNKEALVLTLYERHVEALEARMAAAFREAEGLPLAPGVRLLVQAMVEAYKRAPELQRVLVDEVPRLGGGPRRRKAERAIQAHVRAFLEAHAAEVRHPRPERAAFMVVHLVEALTHAAVREGSLGERALVEELVRLVVGYLEGPGAG